MTCSFTEPASTVLDRVKFYASLIKILEWNNDDDVIANTVRHCGLFSQGPLFQNVRSFSFHDNSRFASSRLSVPRGSLFLNPQLNDLQLFSEYPESDPFCDLLQDLVDKEDKTLHTMQVIDESGMWSRLSSADGIALVSVLSMQDLRHFICNMPLPLNGLDYLSTMPHLAKLKLTLDMKTTGEFCKNKGLYERFTSLTSLDVELFTLTEQSLAFFGSIGSPSLETLKISTLSHCPPVMFKKHLTVLSRSPYRESISILDIALQDGYFVLPKDTDVITSSELRPLLGFPNLRVVRFESAMMKLEEGFMHQLASAWPSVYSFWLQHAGETCYFPVPIGGLVHFARHCPELQIIAMRLDTDIPDLPEWKSSSKADFFCCDLVEGVPDEMVYRCVDFLSVLFPSHDPLVDDSQNPAGGTMLKKRPSAEDEK